MFMATGQVCAATKRTYVHADVYDRLRDALLAVARGIHIGNGLDERMALGPLQNAMQFEKVKCVTLPFGSSSRTNGGNGGDV